MVLFSVEALLGTASASAMDRAAPFDTVSRFDTASQSEMASRFEAALRFDTALACDAGPGPRYMVTYHMAKFRWV
jgi:hypothetical protein